MKALHFRKRDGSSVSYWRCAVCREHRAHPAPGHYVRLGNVVVAVVCDGSCTAALTASLEKLIPDALAEVDEQGFLLS